MSATIYGLEITDLQEGEIPLEAIVIVKVLTDDGSTALSIRHTSGLLAWDRVGMLSLARDRASLDGANGWIPEDDEDG